MLIYSNRGFLRLILVKTGSVFWKPTIVFLGLGSAAVTFLLQLYKRSDFISDTFTVEHHFGVVTIASVIYFAVVFRTTIGWHRYWEAVSRCNAMYTKWMDSYMQMFSFSNASIQDLIGDAEKNSKTISAWKERVARIKANFVLLSALAVHRLIHGDCERMVQRGRKAKWSEQHLSRRVLRMKDITGAWDLPKFYVMEKDSSKEGYHPLSRSSTGSREGLEEHGNKWSGSRYVVDTMPSAKAADALRVASDRVVLALSWILFDFAALSHELKTPPPIQSRMYQELSAGMLDYSQCMKLADIPFPFPFAQMMAIALSVYIVLTPFYMAAFTTSLIIGPLVSGLGTACLWGLNSTAIELENPFGPDLNDIYVADFHVRFMDSLNEVGMANDLVSMQRAVERREVSSDLRRKNL